MKNTHTPGPWVIQTCNANGPFLDSFFISTEERIVCRFPTGTGQFSETGQENLANARLIAAAPELLSALEDMLCAYMGDREMTAEDCVCAADIARAAIAKAKGEA
jgi:hypothetical protein